MSSDSEIRPILIDNGSAFIKAGFTGEDRPRAVFPTVVGKSRQACIMVGCGQRDFYVGDDAICNRNLLLRNPINRGIVTNSDDMEHIWHHTFYNELRVAPEEHPILMTESIFASAANRETMTQIMFETFNAPSLYVTSDAALTLAMYGKTSGLVLECGAEKTNAIPFYEEHGLKYAGLQLDFAGNDLTDYLLRMLNEKGHALQTPAEYGIVKDIKEKLCWVALDPNKECPEISKEYIGQTIKLGHELLQCPEALFQPGFLGRDSSVKGIHHLICSAISKVPTKLQPEMWSNIVLGGGSVKFPGFSERLTQELTRLAPKSASVKVSTDPQAKFSSWIGGSLKGDLLASSKCSITLEEYDEYGPTFIHRKCY